MDYKTLMVHLELGRDNSGLLKIAGDLAGRYKAAVIGIAACQPIRVLYDEGYGTGDVLAVDRQEMEKEIAAAETQFRTALAGRAASLEWRSVITFLPLAEYIAEQARTADLIITGKDIGGVLLDNTRRVDIGALAMLAGRPILLVPSAQRCAAAVAAGQTCHGAGDCDRGAPFTGHRRSGRCGRLAGTASDHRHANGHSCKGVGHRYTQRSIARRQMRSSGRRRLWPQSSS